MQWGMVIIWQVATRYDYRGREACWACVVCPVVGLFLSGGHTVRLSVSVVMGLSVPSTTATNIPMFWIGWLQNSGHVRAGKLSFPFNFRNRVMSAIYTYSLCDLGSFRLWERHEVSAEHPTVSWLREDLQWSTPPGGMPLSNILPLECELDPVTCFLSTEYGKSYRMSLLRLNHKRAVASASSPLSLSFSCSHWKETNAML